MNSIILATLLFILPLDSSPDPLTVVEQGETVKTIERTEYAVPYFDYLFIDQDNLTTLLNKLNDKIYKHPINAKINDNNEIVEEIPGNSLDKHKFNHLFYNFFYKGSPTKITIPKKSIYPRVSSELLADISVNRIGHYVTYYKEDNQERSHNIVLSTKAINNQVVFPGEEFSFNKVVGKRTKEKGYKRAPVIVKGEYAEDIGGGICQVSSTLFNAVNLEGIQIVKRYSHSRSVPYVPPGKDATVSWWGPDFVFKNIYNQPILIRATSEHGKMLINIYSAEDVIY